jgi:hypothetical protein
MLNTSRYYHEIPSLGTVWEGELNSKGEWQAHLFHFREEPGPNLVAKTG